MLDPDTNPAELLREVATSTSDRLKVVSSGQHRTVSIDQTFLEDVESMIAQSEAQRLTKDDDSDEDAMSLVEAKTAARDKFRWLTSSTLAQFSSSSYDTAHQRGAWSLNEGHDTGLRRRITPSHRDGSHDGDNQESSRSSSHKSAATYLAACARYSLTPNGGALLGLSLGLEMLEVDGTISNLDLVPLFAALLEAPFVYHLKLSGHPLQDTGAAVLALALPGCPWIRELELTRCRITGVGVRALCDAIPKSGVTQLVLRGNLLRQNPQHGNQALASVVGRARHLKEVDLQSCGLTSQGMRLIKRALNERGQRGCPCCTVAFEGNFVLVEVLNSLTHGICALVSMEAWRMLNRLTVRLCHLESRIALTLYMVSMTLMFLGSTLYHSMFAVTDLAWFFKMIDHCAIYILIAGTYTPVMVMGCRDNSTMEIQSMVHLVVLIYWGVVVIGIVMEHVFAAVKPPWYSKFIIGMYLLLGFGGVPYIAGCPLVHEGEVMIWIDLGGLTYVIGLLFFLLDRRYPAMHVIWHLLVSLAAFFHFVAVWNLATAVLKEPNRVCQPQTLFGLGAIADIVGWDNAQGMASAPSVSTTQPTAHQAS